MRTLIMGSCHKLNEALKPDLASLIYEKLKKNKLVYKEKFLASATDQILTRHLVIDELLPPDLAIEIYKSFPESSQMRLMKSFRELKRTSKSFNKYNPILLEISMAFQDIRVIEVINEITEIQQQVSDPSFYAGGLSMMGKNSFLNPHIDNSHNQDRSLYRTLNLLYYVTPDWKQTYGGNLELWDKDVKFNVEIHSQFNRLVLMETHMHSWHSVNPIKKEGLSRCCVSNYYFSKKDPNKKSDTFHITAFAGRPDEPIKRILSKADRLLRSGVRKLISKGLGKKDTFK